MRHIQEIKIEEAQRADLQKSKNITVSDTADQWLRSQCLQSRVIKTISHCTAKRITRRGLGCPGPGRWCHTLFLALHGSQAPDLNLWQLIRANFEAFTGLDAAKALYCFLSFCEQLKVTCTSHYSVTFFGRK